MSAISLTDLTKTYANGFTAVRGITLAIRDREFMVLVGPSGCGKTTTLRMIAGLEDVTRGEIRIGERRVNEVEPKDRDIAMVFQNYALYPHMTVFENMAYALTLRRTPRALIEEKVRAAAQLLGLVEQLPKQPKQLSGGQRQRVAVGRAIVREPKAFLFDEPLSNLDAKLRTGMRYELKTLQRRLQTTMVYVTHDQVEAMTLGDRITVMSDGEIQQVAPPTVIYGQPWNRFVAAFIGTPAMNFLSGVLASGLIDRSFIVAGTPLRLTMPHQDRLPSAGDQPMVLGVRPEHLVSVAHQPAPADASILPMRVRLIEAMGDHQCIYLAPADQGAVLTMTCEPHHRFSVGERLDIAIDTRQAHIFAGDGEFAPNLTLPPDFARQQ